MDDNEKKTLNKYRKELCDHIPVTDDLLATFVQKGLITEAMISTVKEEKHSSDKFGKLLDLTMNRKGSENAFSKVSSIVEQHYPVIGKKLQAESAKDEQRHGLRREATDDTSGSGMQENRHDSDIKTRVGIITHKIFGLSKKMSERDKRSVEKWLGDQMQTERNHWKDEMAKNARELEKQIFPKVYGRIQKINSKLRHTLNVQNGVSDSENESIETEEPMDTLEDCVDQLLIKLRMAHEERKRCLDVMKVPPNSQHHRLDQLIMVVKKTYKEKIYQVQTDGDERSERLEGELQCYAEHIRDLEDAQKMHKAKIEHLEKDLRELRIEKSKIEEKCANFERQNIQLRETDLKILRLQNAALEERCASLERINAMATNSEQDNELKRSIQELQKQFDESQVELQTYRKLAGQHYGSRFQRVAALAITQHKTKKKV